MTVAVHNVVLRRATWATWSIWLALRDVNTYILHYYQLSHLFLVQVLVNKERKKSM